MTKKSKTQKPSLFIELKIGKEVLKLSKEEIEARRGIHKITVNKIVPWIEKVLRKV